MDRKVRDFLKYIKVIQEKTFVDSFNRKYTKRRLNPFNPITYIILIITTIIGILLFGFIGFWIEADIKDFNFKYK